MSSESYKPTRGWLGLQPLLGGILIFLSAVIIIQLQWRPFEQISVFRPQSSSANVMAARDMKLVLRPGDHLSRDPRVRRFRWTITSEPIRPDGVRKEVIHINGKFPGPTVELRTGDTIEVEILNSYHQGVSIHWHGLNMKGANHMDGPVGITQCAVAPGNRFTYHFVVESQSGTFWYHAHSEAQIGDGLYGALVVHDPGTIDQVSYGYDEELLLLVGDWYHQPSAEVLSTFMNAASDGNEPCPDSLLVNGMGYFDCSRARPAFPVDCRPVQKPSLSLNQDLRYRVRVVNVGSMAGISIGMTSSNINVTHLDGGQRVASDTANIVGIVYPGERVDFILDWPTPNSEGNSQLIIKLDNENFQSPNLALTPTQSFSISSNSNTNSLDDIEMSAFDVQSAKRRPLDMPLPEPEKRFVVYSAIETLSRLHNVPTSFINRTNWAPQSLPLASLPREEWDGHQLVPWTGSEPVWVDLVINNMDGTGHPFHFHGHNFYVISSYRGKGGWDYYNPFDSKEPRGGPFNTIDPLRKDTVYVPAFGYVVLRFLADNGGLWILHCHILWHFASGMSMTFQVLGDENKAFRDTIIGTGARDSCLGSV